MDLKLKMFDSLKDKYNEFVINLNEEQAIENNLIPKLAIHDMIKRLEDAEKTVDSNNKDIILAVKGDIENQLLDLSLQYQVLSKKTAFICQVVDKSLKNGSLPKEKIIVPQIESADYKIKEEPEYHALGMAPGYGGALRRKGAPAPQLNSLCAMRPSASNGMVNKCKSMKKKESYQPEMKSMAQPQSFTSLSLEEDDSLADVMTNERQARNRKPCSSTSSLKRESESAPQNSLLEVIKNQEIAGYWDESDKSTLAAILSNGSMPQLPESLKNTSDPLKVWLTILVLIWFEKSKSSEESAWKLIHRKATQWLKSAGVNHKDFSNEAAKYIKA
mmetsp:Transcript_16580/g.14418  ORF Transcript_16580/g.14418 Transcript_16580/m.14418 type:complete len:331 (+) Transcript_16580:892-1884(+)